MVFDIGISSKTSGNAIMYHSMSKGNMPEEVGYGGAKNVYLH
jgi:hypothetical protein